MFVRSGSILATQSVQQYAGERAIDEVQLEVWPDRTRPSNFEIYDDDGETRAYERGVYFSQAVTCRQLSDQAEIDFAQPRGSYASPIATYRIVLHIPTVGKASWNGGPVAGSWVGRGKMEFQVPAGNAGRLIVRQ